MKTVILSIAIFSLLVLQSANSQVTQEWVARYNGPANSYDDANSIAIDGLGNIYVTGNSYGNGTSYDYATIKYSPSGVQQWVARYDGPVNGIDYAYAIAVDNLNNIIVTGYSQGIGTSFDYTTIKYNSSGIQQWEARYNGPDSLQDYAFEIAVDASGNIYVTGNSRSNTSNGDIVTVKYNSSGVQQWAVKYYDTANGSDGASSICADALGNVYVAGGSYSSITGSCYITIKYNSSGVQQWSTTYLNQSYTEGGARSLAVDVSGNVYVTGQAVGYYATIKYSSSGVLQWVAKYNGPGNGGDVAYAIAVDNLNNVYVTGTSSGIGTYSDYATVKYNSSGVQQWAARYSSEGYYEDIARSVKVDAQGNVYVTGYSSTNSTNADYATVKYNSSGVQQWVMRYNGPGNGNDEAFSMVLDSSGNVYVTGSSLTGGTNYDYTTIKYSQTVSIRQITNEIPKIYKLNQNYPNPFNPSTKIKFDIPTPLNPPFRKGGTEQLVKLIVFDILGREVAMLVNEQLKPGSYEVEWDGSNYPSGVYFYRLQTESFSETKRMALIK